MRVSMLSSMAGPSISLAPGDVHEFGDKEARRLIDAGYAEEYIEPQGETPAERVKRLEAELRQAKADLKEVKD